MKRNFNLLSLIILIIFNFDLLFSQADTAWVRRYNGPRNGNDFAYAMAVDDNGNVYVTGRSEAWGTSYDYCTIKYDKNGNELWIRRYNGPGNSWDGAYALAFR